MVVSGLQDQLRDIALPAFPGEPVRTIRRWQTIPFPAAAAVEAMPAPGEGLVPAWLQAKAAPEPEARLPLRPSYAALGAEASFIPLPDASEPGPTQAEARLAGVLAHRLLEILPALPPAARPGAAADLIRLRGAALPEPLREEIAHTTLALLADPALEDLFGPDSRAEVSISGTITLPSSAEPRPVLGQVDRLAVTRDTVVIADFKTSPRIPASAAETPPHYVAQLAVYRALVAQLYPRRIVRVLLIWTAAGIVHELDSVELDAALARIKPA